MNRYLMTVIVILAIAVSASGQQKPTTNADKAAAERSMDEAAKKAAEMAEAMARAQQKVAEEARRADEERVRRLEAQAIIPVDVEVVISRYQGDKKTSGLPYSLATTANGDTSLRMGANVPVPNNPVTADGKPATPFLTYNYQNVGTDIDVQVRGPFGDGRFTVSVKVEERSVVQQPGSPTTAAGAPVIRNFAAQNSFVLRDGQTRQFTAAADRVTGEVVKVDVTLKVAK